MSSSVATVAHGSFLYGTKTRRSDVDFVEVVLPDPRDLLLGRVVEAKKSSTRERDDGRNGPDDVDTTTYTLKRFLELLVANDPVALDVYFAPAFAIVGTPSPVWEAVRAAGPALLNLAGEEVLTYARRRVNRYGLPGSRLDAKRRLVAVLEHLDPSARLRDVLDEVVEAVGLPEHVASTPGVEGSLSLDASGRIFEGSALVSRVLVGAVAQLVAHAPPVDVLSAPDLDAEWKILAHAVRVAGQAEEFFRTGSIAFPRPDATYLVDVRAGRYSVDAVGEVLVGRLKAASAARTRQSSSLAARHDPDVLEDLVVSAYRGVVT